MFHGSVLRKEVEALQLVSLVRMSSDVPMKHSVYNDETMLAAQAEEQRPRRPKRIKKKAPKPEPVESAGEEEVEEKKVVKSKPKQVPEAPAEPA